MILSVAIAMLVCAFAAIADAQNVPHLEPGRFVYGIPDGYINPTVGSAGVESIEDRVRRLHHPFFIIFIDELRGSGDANAQATTLLENIVAAWQTTQPNLFTPEAGAFMQVTSPRKYRLTAGSRWVTELGLGQEQITPFGRDHFVPYMRRRPENPTTGILETVSAIDTYVFERTDPDFLHQQQEAATRAQLARNERRLAEERAEALRSLQQEIGRAESLLITDARYLPSDMRPHDVALNAARQMQSTPDAPTSSIQDAASRLHTENNWAWGTVRDRRDAESNAALLRTIGRLLLVAIFIALAFMIRSRIETIRKLRQELADTINDWRSKVDAATRRLSAFDEGSERVQTLANTRGRTGALYQDVTKQIADLKERIDLAGAHLKSCAALGAKGWFFNADPLRAAITSINNSIPIDIDASMSLAGFESDVTSRFTRAMDGWERLQAAFAASNCDPRTDLSYADFEALRTHATDGHVPTEWLCGHPLARDAEALYTELTTLRGADIIAYLDEVKALRRQMDEVKVAVSEIVTIVEPVFGERDAVALPAGTIVDEADSPAPFIHAARRGEEELAAMLKSLRPKDELTSKVAEILRARTSARQKIDLIVGAQQRVNGAIELACAEQARVHELRAAATRRLAEAQTNHAGVDVAAFNAGTHQLDLGTTQFLEAQRALTNKRHVAAERIARNVYTTFQEAGGRFDQAITYFNALDQAALDTPGQIAQVNKAHGRVLLAKDQADTRLTQASPIHANIGEARRYIEAAVRHIEAGGASVRHAQAAATDRRYLEAISNASNAASSFTKAFTALEDAKQWCDEQDRKKAEYEAFVAHAGRYRSSAESRISAVGRTMHLALFQARSTNSPANWGKELAEAQATKKDWDKAAATAEAEHQDDLRRKAEAKRRTEEEARRRAEAEAEEERRRRRRAQEEEDDRKRRQQDDDDRRRSSFSDSGSSYGGGGDAGGGGGGGDVGGSNVGGGDY